MRDPADGNRLVDFWDWSKERVDEKFLHDLQAACDRDLPPGDPAVAKCKGTPRWFATTCVRSVNVLGPALDAQDALNFVTQCGDMFWNYRPDVAGDWYFVDDVPPTGVVRIRQDAAGFAGQRHITAEWVPTLRTAPASNNPLDLILAFDISLSKFEGTLKTYDAKWEAEGPITITIKSDDKTQRDVYQATFTFELVPKSEVAFSPLVVSLSAKACKAQDCTSTKLTRSAPPASQF